MLEVNDFVFEDFEGRFYPHPLGLLNQNTMFLLVIFFD